MSWAPEGEAAYSAPKVPRSWRCTRGAIGDRPGDDGGRTGLRGPPRILDLQADHLGSAGATAATIWVGASGCSSSRSSASAGCSSGRCPDSRTSSRSGPSSSSPPCTSRRTARCSTPTSTSRSSGVWPALGFLQDTIALLCLISLGVFAVIRIRNAPERKARDQPVLRQPHRRRLAHPVHDLQRAVDAVLLPRARPRRWAPSRTSRGRGCPSGWARCSPGCRRARSTWSRASGCCCTSASCWSS